MMTMKMSFPAQVPSRWQQQQSGSLWEQLLLAVTVRNKVVQVLIVKDLACCLQLQRIELSKSHLKKKQAENILLQLNCSLRGAPRFLSSGISKEYAVCEGCASTGDRACCSSCTSCSPLPLSSFSTGEVPPLSSGSKLGSFCLLSILGSGSMRLGFTEETAEDKGSCSMIRFQ